MPAASPAKSANRRNDFRHETRKTVSIECRKGAHGFGRNVAIYCLDVSQGGARLICSEDLPRGTECEVLLTGYGLRSSIRRLAQVQWAIQLEGGFTCLGVQFTKPLTQRDVDTLSVPR